MVIFVFLKIKNKRYETTGNCVKDKGSIGEDSPNAKTILYGSEARGDARPDSDIDLLILINKEKVSADEEKTIIGKLCDIEQETRVLISLIILPLSKWENRPFKTPFYINVMNEGIVL